VAVLVMMRILSEDVLLSLILHILSSINKNQTYISFKYWIYWKNNFEKIITVP
jgi:hypothetical protein